jgi:hypothetical protein
MIRGRWAGMYPQMRLQGKRDTHIRYPVCKDILLESKTARLILRLSVGITLCLLALGIICVYSVTGGFGYEVCWILIQLTISAGALLFLIYFLWLFLKLDARRENRLRYANPFIV